ncbi:hypothetical protein ADK52_24325 [Streptomyces sp. WM6372]|uniref:hypothetical protein n=1 Tax=Streptomyces sp. WM6372 TaxID=1415555 RepID=UPI0006B04B77|nr:hypothetical protein [Streptomyces sp. WM6372]KOU21253.1 hypothetical protein ADK52_24325 [Streptomyces sp. WM6372]
MSTPPPSPYSPGPYGPPQQPSPYGGQQYPYPPQPQPPYPGHVAWGQPPMGPPPGGRRTGRNAGVIVATVVGLVVAGFVLNRMKEVNQHTSGVGFPEAKYRLTVPKTLLGGSYALAEDLSQTQGKEAIKGYDPDIRNPEPATGRYTSGSPTEPDGVLVLSGMYGQFKDPADARRKMMDGAAKADGAKTAVPPRDITPTGTGITVTCQVLTSVEQGETTTLPMCSWADENTSAAVAAVTPETARQAPASVDLDGLARTTLKVRAEARQPIN